MAKRKPDSEYTHMRVYHTELAQLDELRGRIEAETGLAVTLGSLMRRCMREGIVSIKQRPILGIDFVWKKGETE